MRDREKRRFRRSSRDKEEPAFSIRDFTMQKKKVCSRFFATRLEPYRRSGSLGVWECGDVGMWECGNVGHRECRSGDYEEAEVVKKRSLRRSGDYEEAETMKKRRCED